MFHELVMENKILDFLKLMGTMIYFDIDSIAAVYVQGGVPGINLVSFQTLDKRKIDPDSCKPYVIWQNYISEDSLERKKVIMFDCQELNNKNRLLDYIKIPDVKKHLIQTFKEHSNLQIMEKDIIKNYTLDLDNQLLVLKAGLTDLDFIESILCAYAEQYLQERMENDVATWQILKFVLLQSIGSKTTTPVAVAKLMQLDEQDIKDLLIDIQNIIWVVLWDLFEKRFTWTETILLHYADGNLEEIQDFISNYDITLAEKLDGLNNLQIFKLRDYLQSGLTVNPICAI